MSNNNKNTLLLVQYHKNFVDSKKVCIFATSIVGVRKRLSASADKSFLGDGGRQTY